MVRKNIMSDTVSASGSYSHAIDTGDYIFFSGQTPMNALDYVEGETKGNITQQTKKALEHLDSVMKASNVTSDEVVKVNVYLTSMDYFKEMNEVYAEFFNAPYPARTCVAVYELPLGADVEIEAIVKRNWN